MSTSIRSPRILHLDWGRLEIEGLARPLRDAKLWPGGAREWDWSETGTHHVPGIQLADVEELLDHGARTVILARGVEGRLRVMPETLEELARRGVEAHVLTSGEAVERYNALAVDAPVGALIHSTC